MKQLKILVLFLFLFTSHEVLAHIMVECDPAQQAELEEAWESKSLSEKNEALDVCVNMMKRWLLRDVRIEEDITVKDYAVDVLEMVGLSWTPKHTSFYYATEFAIYKMYHLDVREKCIVPIEQAKNSLEEELQDPQKACVSGHQNRCKRRQIARNHLAEINEAFSVLREWNETYHNVQCSHRKHTHSD